MGAPADITQAKRNQRVARHMECYQTSLAPLHICHSPDDCFQQLIAWDTGQSAHLPAGAAETRGLLNLYYYHHRQYRRYYWRYVVRLLLPELGTSACHHYCVYSWYHHDTILGRLHKNSWPGFARLDSHWGISAAIYGTGGMGHHPGTLKRTLSYRCTRNISGFCLPARQPLCSKHSVPGSAPGSESWNSQNTKLRIGPGDLLAWRFPRCYPLYSHWSRGQGYRVHPGR